MKKQLSLALLTLSIFSLNILPARAMNNNITGNLLRESNVFSTGQWCVGRLPLVGFICLDL